MWGESHAYHAGSTDKSWLQSHLQGVVQTIEGLVAADAAPPNHLGQSYTLLLPLETNVMTIPILMAWHACKEAQQCMSRKRVLLSQLETDLATRYICKVKPSHRGFNSANNHVFCKASVNSPKRDRHKQATYMQVKAYNTENKNADRTLLIQNRTGNAHAAINHEFVY